MHKSVGKLHLAIQRAEAWHRGHDRDGDCPLPYITHPIEVLVNLRTIGTVIDEDLLAVAVLHDTLEDTRATTEEILAEFGPWVTSLVEQLTRQEPSDRETQSLSPEEIWSLRAGMLLDEIARMSPEAQTVKLADRLSNVREALGTKRGKKLARYLDQSKRILKIVPKSVNPGLWNAIEELLEKQKIEEGRK